MECYSRLIFVMILAHSSLKLEGCATNCSGVPPKKYNICGGTDCSQYLDCVGSKQLMTCAPMFFGSSWFDEFQQSCAVYSNTCPNFLPDQSGQWNFAPESSSSSSSSNGNVPMVSMFSWTPLQYSVPSEWLSGPVSASAGTPPGGPWSAAAPVNGGSGSSNSPNDISSAMHSALTSDVDYPDVVTTNDAGKALSDTSTPPYSTSSASSMETNPIGSTAAGAGDSSSSGTFSTTVSGASAPTTSSSDMASSPPPPPPPIVAWYVNARPAVDANATTATATDAVHAVACVRLCLLARWPPPPSPLCEAIAVENDRSPIDVRCFFYSKGWNDQPMVDDDSMTTYHVVRR